MAEISYSIDDDEVIKRLLKLRPGVEFGPAHDTEVTRVDTGKCFIEITTRYDFTPEEMAKLTER